MQVVTTARMSQMLCDMWQLSYYNIKVINMFNLLEIPIYFFFIHPQSTVHPLNFPGMGWEIDLFFLFRKLSMKSSATEKMDSDLIDQRWTSLQKWPDFPFILLVDCVAGYLENIDQAPFPYQTNKAMQNTKFGLLLLFSATFLSFKIT